ncbi:MAG TPA: hypothetical protein VIG51_13545 [Candidatus Baltobacteraceae bacterium]
MTASVPRSATFDLLVSICTLWIASGFFLDAWAHGHVPVESFFTPYHGVFYSGMLALVFVIAFFALRNRRRGYAWKDALPAAYRIPVWGFAIFLAAGIGDLLWHELLGIEEGVDALLSPTHQGLGLGIFFLASGPINSALRERDRLRSVAQYLPLIFSLATWILLAHFGTAYAFDPAAGRTNAPPAIGAFSPHYLTAVTIGYYKIGTGVLIVLFQSLLMAGFALFVAAQFRTPPGTLVLLFLLGNTPAAAAFTNDTPLLITVMLMSVAAGAAGDFLIARVDPSRERVAQYRLFGIAVPVVYFATYFIVTAVTDRLWWDWNVVLGATIWAGVIGLGLTFLTLPAPSRR